MSTGQHAVQNSKFLREWGTESITGAALIWWEFYSYVTWEQDQDLQKGTILALLQFFSNRVSSSPVLFIPQGCQWLWSVRGRKPNKQNNTHSLSIPLKSSTVWTLLTDWDSLPSWEATQFYWNQITLSTDILVSVITALLCLLFQYLLIAS